MDAEEIEQIYGWQRAPKVIAIAINKIATQEKEKFTESIAHENLVEIRAIITKKLRDFG